MEVKEYSDENFANSLLNNHTSASQVREKKHLKYFTGYLKDGLNAQTIVIERNYISKDFISDYASYYSTCYVPYDKTCTRLHFFSLSFNEDEFRNAITLKDSPIWESYLGYIVVKPLPITIIGFTLLKTFPGEGRNFFGIRKYKVHLYGNELPISSLAFQEQDSVLSACATTAIWSMLHKASLNEHTTLKTPNEITKSVGTTGFDGGRLFPNKRGLSVGQMCKAIVSSGLETELRRVTKADTYDVSYVKQLIHSYSSIGIPIILIISAHNTPENRLNKKFPHHAVTVTGFKDSTLPQRPRQDTVYLRSESITKLYVHDDQWGPFARMEFGVNGKVTSHWDSLYLGYTNIETVIIPIYPKIRIAYDDIKEVVFSIDNLLFEAYTQIECDFEWEIGLELSEVYKNFIRNFNLAEKDKFEFLVKSCPRYIWRASCYYKGSRTIDFIFDATDISANRIVIHSIFFSKDVKKYLREFFDKEKNRYKELFKNEKYYEFIVSSVNVD